MHPSLESAKQKFIAGDLDGAEREARELRRAAKASGDVAGVGRARALLAEIAYDRLRYAEARDEMQRAVSELERELPPADVAPRQGRASLAVVLQSMNDYDGSKTELDLAIAGQENPPQLFDVEAAHLWITIAVALERFDAARARRILESIVHGGLDPALPMAASALATAHLHLATVVEHAGERSLAQEHEERCIELRTCAFGAANVRVAAARFGLARVLLAGGQVDAARGAAREAMATLQKIGADREPRMSTAYATLGVTEVIAGDVETGTRYLETACAIEESSFGASSPETASMLIMLVQVHATRGNWGKAAGLCTRIVRGVRDSPAFEDTYALACELESTALLALGRPRDAVPRLRSALEIFERRGTVKPERRAQLWAALGRCEALVDNVARGINAFEKARAAAADAGDDDLVAAINRDLDHLRRGDRMRLKGHS